MVFEAEPCRHRVATPGCCLLKDRASAQSGVVAFDRELICIDAPFSSLASCVQSNGGSQLHLLFV